MVWAASLGDELIEIIHDYSTHFHDTRLKDTELQSMYYSSLVPLISTPWLFLYYLWKKVQLILFGSIDLILITILQLLNLGYQSVEQPISWFAVIQIIIYQIIVFMAEDALIFMSMIPIINILTNISIYLLIAVLESNISRQLKKVFTDLDPKYDE